MIDTAGNVIAERWFYCPRCGGGVDTAGNCASGCVSALAIIRDVRRRYSGDTAGCADATLALDEVARRIRAERRKRKRKAAK